MLKKSNIALVGLMGSGKTTVGKLLANKLSLKFVDIDDEIEKSEKMKIARIFELNGEPYFRNLETEALKKFVKMDNLVISTGGGAVQKQENLEIISSYTTTIYLKASVDTLYSRLLGEIDNRPMLKTENPKQKLCDLLEIRESNYCKSNIIVETDDLYPNQVVDNIVSSIKRL